MRIGVFHCSESLQRVRSPVIALSLMFAITIPLPGELNGQVRTAPAQDSSRPRLGAKAELENAEQAHGPASEDFDPDVAKRPALYIVLNEKRIWNGMHSLFSPWFSREEGHFLVSQDIPNDHKELLRGRWGKVIAPQFLPTQEEEIEWRESNDYPTAPEQRRISTRWRTSARTVIVDGSPAYNGIKVCLQLSSDDRISFRFKEPQAIAASTSRLGDGEPEDLVDKLRLLEIFSTCFRFPFGSIQDFRVSSGPSGTYEGVRIFSGEIRWARRLEGRPELAGIGQGISGYNEASLFITDSEPQYFCVRVSIPEVK